MSRTQDDPPLFLRIKKWIERGDNDKIKSILEHTAPTDLSDKKDLLYNSKLLHFAAAHGNVDSIEHLISIGLQVDAKDSADDTPLLVALHNEHWAATECLLQHNADVFARGRDGHTALSIVMLNDRADLKVLQFFFDRVKTISADKRAFVATLVQHHCPLNKIIHLRDAEITEIYLDTPGANDMDIYSVDIAMRSMDKENMRVLLHHGERASDGKDLFLRCLLHRQITGQSVDGIWRVAVKQITEWKIVSVELGLNLVIEYVRQVPMARIRHLLSDENLAAYIKRDFDHDIHLDLYANCTFRPRLTTRKGNLDMNSLVKNGTTALHLAARHCVEETMEYLLDCGMNPNVRDEDGKTPVFEINCFRYHELPYHSCLYLLLHYGAAIQATVDSGNIYIDCKRPDELSNHVINAIVAQLAVLVTFGVSLKKSFRNYVFSHDPARHHFTSCCLQLEKLKIQKIHDSLTLLEILAESPEKLIRRARPLDRDAIEQFFESNVYNVPEDYVICLKYRLNWAVRINTRRDRAVAAICDSIQVLKPYHLVVEKICSFLSYYDLRVFE